MGLGAGADAADAGLRKPHARRRSLYSAVCVGQIFQQWSCGQVVRELGLDIDVAYLSDSTLDAAVEGAMRNGWGITKANVRAVKAKRGTEKLKLCANILKARNVRNRAR